MGNVDKARQSLSAYYEESLTNRIVQLEEWLGAFDVEDAAQLDAIRRVGHQMRGSGASFGFERITEIGERVELCPIDDLRDALGALVDEVHLALVVLHERNASGGDDGPDLDRAAEPSTGG